MKRMLQLVALVIVLAIAGQAAMALPPHIPTWCGDPCSPNGAETGCVCRNGNGVLYRTICYCSNGHWVG